MGYFIIEQDTDHTPEVARVCSVCGQCLPLEEFYLKRKRSRGDHRMTKCKDCHKKRMSERWRRIRTEGMA